MAATNEVIVNRLEHDTVHGGSNSLVQVDSDTYVLAYTDSANNRMSFPTLVPSPLMVSRITKVNGLEHDTTHALR